MKLKIQRSLLCLSISLIALEAGAAAAADAGRAYTEAEMDDLTRRESGKSYQEEYVAFCQKKFDAAQQKYSDVLRSIDKSDENWQMRSSLVHANSTLAKAEDELAEAKKGKRGPGYISYWEEKLAEAETARKAVVSRADKSDKNWHMRSDVVHANSAVARAEAALRQSTRRR